MNLDSILKSRDITLSTKVRLVKAMVFPAVPVWQALSGHKRSNTLAVELPPQARGTGTLIPSVRHLDWAGKHQLGNAAWGASFPSERPLPA